MAKCPNCGTAVPDDARFCPNCGTTQPYRAVSAQQPPLPFSPWGPPLTATQPGGGAAVPARPEPAVGPPLTARQVWITVTALLIFLIFLVLFAGRNWGSGGGTPPSPPASAPSGGNQAEQPPVLGVMGEAVTVGNTVVGAAFTDTSETFNDKPAEHGQFFAVGIIIGNKGQANFTLDIKSVGLLDRSSGTRYQPMVSAWGTPDDLRNGKYTPTYPLSPQETIAGIIVFDVPKGLAQQRLLVRDLTTGDAAFTGTIDLTKEAQR